MACTPMTLEEMLRFQMSLVRLMTPAEPPTENKPETAPHPVAEQLEALVRKANRPLAG
jgi:hypothetical protein